MHSQSFHLIIVFIAPLLGEGDGTLLQYSCLEKSHVQRSLVGCSPWGREESDRTERLHFLFSPSCIGEGNGNPLQCSCLENPRDGGAWWAAVYGVSQSQTWLKQLSSSSSSFLYGPTLTFICYYWKNHSLDLSDLCWQSSISAF